MTVAQRYSDDLLASEIKFRGGGKYSLEREPQDGEAAASVKTSTTNRNLF